MFPFSFIIELLCFFCALYYLRHEKKGIWYWLPWFMLFTSITDGSGWLLSILYPTAKNHWLYNLILPVTVLFIWWIFYNIYKPLYDSRIWLIVCLLIFSISYVVETINKGFLIYNFTTVTITGVLFVIASGWYYYLLLKQEEYLNLMHHPPFWIVTGIFLFYFGGTAISLFFEDLMKLNIAKGIPVRSFIAPVLNLAFYGSWAYAFRCRYQHTIL